MSATMSCLWRRVVPHMGAALLAICAGAANEAKAQNSEQTAARLVAGLTIATPLRRPLQAAMAQAFREEACEARRQRRSAHLRLRRQSSVRA